MVWHWKVDRHVLCKQTYLSVEEAKMNLGRRGTSSGVVGNTHYTPEQIGLMYRTESGYASWSLTRH
jgi:hypothetical protein